MLRVTNEEGKVELFEDLVWHDGRVSGLRSGIVRVRRAFRLITIHSPIRGRAVDGRLNAIDVIAVDGAVDGAVGPNSTLQLKKRRSDARRFLMRRNQVVNDILDEKTLSLL